MSEELIDRGVLCLIGDQMKGVSASELNIFLFPLKHEC